MKSQCLEWLKGTLETLQMLLQSNSNALGWPLWTSHAFPSLMLMYAKLTHLSIMVRVKASKNELLLFKGVLLKAWALLMNNSFIRKSFWELKELLNYCYIASLSLLVSSFNWKQKCKSCFMTDLLDSLQCKEIKSCFSWISIPNYSIKAESQDV